VCLNNKRFQQTNLLLVAKHFWLLDLVKYQPLGRKKIVKGLDAQVICLQKGDSVKFIRKYFNLLNDGRVLQR